MENIYQIKMDLKYKVINNEDVKKSTIIDKVVYLLGNSKDKIFHLKDLYASLSGHTQTSIRGNINRHIKKMKENSLIKRVVKYDENGKELKGYYTLSEIITVKKDAKDGKLLVSYVATHGLNGLEVSSFHKDFKVEEKNCDVQCGKYISNTEFNDFSDFIKNKESMVGMSINADVRDIFKKIKDESFDLAITDPPYKVIAGGKPKKKGQPKGMLSKNDGKIFKHNDIEFSEWVPELFRVLKNGSHAYIFTNFLNLDKLMKVCRDVGFHIHNLLVWKKNNAVVNGWYMKNCEYVLLLRKGKSKRIKNAGSKTVHEFDNILGDKIHPTEKPEDLLSMYLENSSEKGDWVIDPFGGSMSLARSCIKTFRRFFVVEKDKTFFDVGKNSIKKVLSEI